MAENSYYGISRQDEDAKYHEVKRIARDRVKMMEASVNSLAAELNELREVYDLDEKEGLAQWFNKDNRFREVRQDLQRATRAQKKPYFGRIDYIDAENNKKDTYYIGKTVIYEDPANLEVIDWRAPIASIYYDQNLGDCRFLVPGVGVQEVKLERKRTYELDDEGVRDFYDSEVVANDELLTKYLSKSSRNVLGEIIATIQQEQNEVIRINPHHNVLIQGSAGSGKTTVAMHRISYILYNYEREFAPADFYIVGSNKILLNYITGVLPDLDVYDIGQMTMEELFVRLLYEEWDNKKCKVRKYNKMDPLVGMKGTKEWFDALETFCKEYLNNFIPSEDIILEKNGHVIMSSYEIQKIISTMEGRTIKDIYDRLTDILISHLETELFGRGLSYPKEEQKRLYRIYEKYFKKNEIKKSVYEIYEEFVQSQNAKSDAKAKYVSGEFDLYDLGCLAYIYKALKETEVIREACHVVIDEAQDFGIGVYRSLKYCLNKCTFTIMGDVSQNVNFGCGLGDWEDLKQIMLPDPYDYFGLLRKSYRNTIEISTFANDILKHGTFPIYPVEPIIRHGEEVKLNACSDEKDLINHIKNIADKWKLEYETIALICKDEQEAEHMYTVLENENKNCGADGEGLGLKINKFEDEEFNLSNGLTVLPIEYSKGLEFDAVIICDASKTAYPKEDGYAKLLYVAATRALHELEVCYIGELTGLIADPIPADRENVNFAEDTFHKKARVFAADERTASEIARDQSLLGDSEKELRAKYGPKRSEAKAVVKPIKKIAGVGTTSAFKINKKIDSAVVKTEIAQAVAKRASENGGVTASIPGYGVGNGTVAGVKRGNAGSAKGTSNSVSKLLATKIKTEFGDAPEGSSLLPLGHGKIDTSVKWIDIQKDKVLITSFYGVMAISIVDESCVRVTFKRGELNNISATPHELLIDTNTEWKCNQLRDKVEIVTDKLIVSIDKKTGAVSFAGKSSGVLLSESLRLTRQNHEANKIWWNYFSFGKKEIMKALGPNGEWLDVSGTARYVSNSTDKELNATTTIMSMNGYRLLISAQKRILLNATSPSSAYIKYENSEEIDYFFQIVR